MSFTNKVVLITGAGSGIGAATASEFAKEGAKVVIVDKDETKLKNTAETWESSNLKPLTIHGDITIDSDVKKIIQTTIDNCEQLDVLVNCAGIFHFAGIFHENMLEAYDEIMNVNLRGIIQLTQLAVPYLIESKGNIINISSVVASVPAGQNFLCYGISKAGMTYFSLGLAKDLAPHGVRVNIVAPGAVNTNITAHLGIDNWWDQMRERSALGRISEPEEIAEIILFIAKAKGIHGSIYECNNGFT